MSSTRNIIILGASYAGLSVAHYFLKHVLPHLPKDGKYHVYLVNPSTQFYHRVGSPRATASKELYPDSKSFHEIPGNFKQYSKDSFTFVHGKAISMDTIDRTVTIQHAAGGEEIMRYYALVLATGTRSIARTLSDQGESHEQLQKDLAELRRKLKNARTIIVGGGGPAGVEVAGEIGEMLNGAAGWFAKRPSNPKAEITLIAGGKKLLPILRESIAKQAEVFLNRVGVDVIYKIRVSKTEDMPDGKTRVVLDDGSEMKCDVYIPATGVVPMTEYVPKTLLTDKGYIKTNATTLRVDEAGPRVYAVGDVGSYTRGGVMDIFDAIPALMTNIKRDLLAAHSNPNAKPTGPDRKFKANVGETQLVPVGQNKGVGAFNGTKLPSIAVYMIKGKDYMASSAADFTTGSRWNKESGWKPTDG